MKNLLILSKVLQTYGEKIILLTPESKRTLRSANVYPVIFYLGHRYVTLTIGTTVPLCAFYSGTSTEEGCLMDSTCIVRSVTTQIVGVSVGTAIKRHIWLGTDIYMLKEKGVYVRLLAFHQLDKPLVTNNSKRFMGSMMVFNEPTESLYQTFSENNALAPNLPQRKPNKDNTPQFSLQLEQEEVDRLDNAQYEINAQIAQLKQKLNTYD
ncbi:hypothetical protein K501DRAFT_280112 [Backusella circina FSU 941]|nr:hypothetical protein K501DRAFT_280112 [Backusella circina FSU 941]